MTPAEFTASKFWVSMHFGLTTYNSWVAHEAGAVTPLSNFNPTDLNFESWFDSAQKIGAQGVMLTTKYHDGLCLWPSEVSERNIAATPWYNTNPIDIVQVFCKETRARGLRLGLYASVLDNYFDTLSGAGTYTEWTVAILRELLAYDADIDLLFLDGYGVNWGIYNYTNPVYDDVIGVVRELQPNCLVCINDHEHTAGDVHGDFALWERPSDGPTIPTDFDAFPALALHDPLHPDASSGYIGRWYKHADSGADLPTHLRLFIVRRFDVNRDGWVDMVNYSPGPTGQLYSDTQTMMLEMWEPVGTLLYEDGFLSGTEDAVTLQTLAGWSKAVGSNITVQPSGNLWAPNVYAFYVNSLATFKNGWVDLDFEFLTIPTTFTIQVSLRANADVTNEDHFAINKSGSNIGTSLGTYSNPTSVQLDNPAFSPEVFEVGKKYRVRVLKRDNELRGILYMPDADGNLQQFLRAMGTSSVNSVAGFPGIFISSTAGSPTTGIQLTGFRAYEFNDTAPLPPTLSIGGDETRGHFVNIRSFTKSNKIYRSDDNGDTYQLVYMTDGDKFIDPDWVSGTTYIYRGKGLSPDWVNSNVYSNLLTFTATESDLVDQIVDGLPSTSLVDPAFVDDDHTWRFEADDQLTAANEIKEIVGFNAKLAMDFDRPIPDDTSVDTGSLVVVSPSTGLTIGDILASSNRRKLIIPVVAASAGTYTVVLNANTVGGLDYPRRGVITIETPTGT